MSNSRNILYYSKQCRHSRNILETLSQNSNILSRFDLIDISQNKPPEYITAVPSLLIPKQNGEADMLVGRSVFDWLNNILRQNQPQNQQPNQPPNQQPNQPPNQHPNQQSNQQPNQQPNQQSNQQSNEASILDFDPCTMNGFSDNFSFLGKDNNVAPIDHNFSFLNSNNDKLINPSQFQNTNGEDRESNKVKSDMERAYEKLMTNRDSEVQGAIQRA
jgi:hypothetical protein